MTSEEETDIVMKIETDNEPENETDNEPTEDPLAVCGNAEADLNSYKIEQNQKFLEKAKDIQEMMVIASSILQSCKEETTVHQVSGSQVNKLQYYTKQPLEYLNEVVESERFVKKSLKQVIADTKPLPSSIIPFIYSDIRDIFVDFYVKKKQIPTMVRFLKSLHNKRDDTFYKNANICTLVKNNLVKYHHIPKLNVFILCENPEFGYHRHLYLRQITGYRARGKNVIYVTVLKMESEERRASFIVLAASPTAGLIAKSDTINYAGSYDDESGNDKVKLWMRNELLPKLSSSAVIVLTQPRKKANTPTPSSMRAEMTEWLLKREIPFNVESHKAQLYSLVKLFKKKKEQGLYEEILASGGFKVILCPNEYPHLDFFGFHDLCSNEAGNMSSQLENLMTTLCLEEWNMIEEKIIEQERQMMKDDEEMEKIVENLFQMVKNGDVTEEEFPVGCRGTKADDFAIHIGDIIVD